jgi:hypothetical protein
MIVLRDFTMKLLEQLLAAMVDNQYTCIPYRQYADGKLPSGRFVILRHDMDALPEKALQVAQLENRYQIQGTYYVRTSIPVFIPSILEKIAAMGHEIGYHYENLSDHKGDLQKAIGSFEASLRSLRKIYPVTTICMHGSPLSRYDNRTIWEHYSYRDFGIDAELYLDTDFSNIWYLTDTGRGWNSRYNIRDLVDSRFSIPIEDTPELIQLFREGGLPDKIMITIHPQRWSDNYYDWIREITFQSVKNIVKATLLKK